MNKDSIVQLSRHMLGMAGRKVVEAARFAEGCGYVIVDAAPGTCFYRSFNPTSAPRPRTLDPQDDPIDFRLVSSNCLAKRNPREK